MPAKLFFYYSSMNAGKSSTLLQANYNYNEHDLHTLLFIPKLIGKDKIESRIGLAAKAIQFEPDFNFVDFVKKSIDESGTQQTLGCVLVDEAQFLNQNQVLQLTRVADELQIPVLCYGLRSDFLGEPFEGSKYLLTLADELREIKTICSCGRKASMNQRIRGDGKPVARGEQVEVGGNDRYVGKCRKHFYEGLSEASIEVSECKKRKTDVTPPKKDAQNANINDLLDSSPTQA